MIYIILADYVTAKDEVIIADCNPTGGPSIPGGSALVREIANANPELCLCSSPCTVEKVSKLVRFYYIKRSFYYISMLECLIFKKFA